MYSDHHNNLFMWESKQKYIIFKDLLKMYKSERIEKRTLCLEVVFVLTYNTME